MEKEIQIFLEQKIAACEEKRKRLQEDGYSDEADFEKIRANVYDIFKTVLSAAAKQHDDVKAMHIESIKLDVAQDIKAHMLKMEEKN